MLLNILREDRSNNYYLYLKNEIEEISVLVDTSSSFNFIETKYLSENNWEIRFQRITYYANKLSKKLLHVEIYNYKDSINKVIKKYKIDVVHCPYQQLPLTVSVPCIATMHDVQELYFPEYFSPEARANRAVRYMSIIKKADCIIVSYDHVRNDIIKFFQKDSSLVKTILLDMEYLWINNIKPEDISDVKSIYNLDDNFIFYPAATWKHKGHLELLKAMNILKKKGVKINLVCSGSQTSYYQEELLPMIEELELKKNVKFLGIVSDSDLFSLYKKCISVVIPTHYEAGSFPLMEAMIIGVPVICSDVTSLLDTIGDNRFVFKSKDVSQMAELIEKIISNEGFRKSNLDNSTVQAQKLIHNNSLNKIISVYNFVLKNENQA
jgi:glycosyltransferase involved in cell wall biosynthesis